MVHLDVLDSVSESERVHIGRERRVEYSFSAVATAECTPALYLEIFSVRFFGGCVGLRGCVLLEDWK